MSGGGLESNQGNHRLTGGRRREMRNRSFFLWECKAAVLYFSIASFSSCVGRFLSEYLARS